jgi:hypothetical protein
MDKVIFVGDKQPHVVRSGQRIDEQKGTLATPQWEYRVRPSVSRSQLADIQCMKRTIRAGEL